MKRSSIASGRKRPQLPVEKSSFDWMDETVCDRYVTDREISTSEVHFGWLSPGEASLGLLATIPERARVLDIGCGAGENLIALARRGCRCFGIDISPHMLRIAESKIDASGLIPVQFPQLEKCDMRQLTAFESVEFDLILSIYSCEFLESLKEFREVLATAYGRLADGGRLVVCFSHPLQHHAHKTLLNETGRTGTRGGDPLMFSFRDVVLTLSSIGFGIDRVIEQQTRNPSTISYEASQAYPYHFSKGRNPCQPQFDEISNSAPHTVIYAASKPIGRYDTQSNLAINTLGLNFGGIRLWGRNRKVVDRITERVGSEEISIAEVAPYDSLVAVSAVMDIRLTKEDFVKFTQSTLCKAPAGQGRVASFSSKSALGIVYRCLKERRLVVRLRVSERLSPEHGISESGIYIQSIDPFLGVISRRYPDRKVGILVTVNGEEPASGTVGLEKYFPKIGDTIQVLYIVSGWNDDWRPQGNRPKQNQLEFGFDTTESTI